MPENSNVKTVTRVKEKMGERSISVSTWYIVFQREEGNNLEKD